MSDAPTPQRAASAEGRDRLRKQVEAEINKSLANFPASFHTGGYLAEGVMRVVAAPLLDRITAAEARAEEAKALNRSFAEAHIVISETAQAEEARADAATADRGRIATELAEARADAETVSSLAGKLEADRARLADEVARLSSALRLLLPFVDRAAGEGLEWAEDCDSPRMDAADLCIAAAEALGLELGDDAYSAILSQGESDIRAACALTVTGGTTDGQAVGGGDA